MVVLNCHTELAEVSQEPQIAILIFSGLALHQETNDKLRWCIAVGLRNN
ncbi:hypothetical protein AAON49_05295 [Pseudotenacibaculum sp. MALMAid0570]